MTMFFGSIDWNFMSDLIKGGFRDDRIFSSVVTRVRVGGSLTLRMSVSDDALSAHGVSGAKNVSDIGVSGAGNDSGARVGVGEGGDGRTTVGGSSVESDSHRFRGDGGLGDWDVDLGGVVCTAVSATTGTCGDCVMHSA